MDRAEFLKRATAGAAGLALGTAVTSQRSATSQTARPNILLIMTDGAALVADLDVAPLLVAPAVIALAVLAIWNSWQLTLVDTEVRDI